MTMFSRGPTTSTRPSAAPSTPPRGFHPYPSCLLPVRPPRAVQAQLPLTWEELLGRR